MTSEELQQAFGYLFPDEVRALKQLARGLPDNPVVVNIGAGAGTSGLAFMESRPDLYLYTVDIQSENSPLGSLYSEKMVFVQASIPDGRYTQICADSKPLGIAWRVTFGQSLKIGYGWGKGLIDMVFVDADHTYNGCKGDILAWLPNIKPGGIMAVHDFEKEKRWKAGNLPDKVPHPLPWRGVDRAVRHYLCGKYEIALYMDTLIAFVIK